ncbi:MAG: glycerophosphodiester phosphodiesterase family protein [Ruthenibacterium sp.]
MEILLWSLALMLILVWFLLRPGRFTPQQRAQMQGVNYAHRGLHTRDKAVPENSLAAFDAAVQAGYGIELDIQLSHDGQVVVFHDDTLERVCGVHGRVDAFSLAELQDMRLCGTQQSIPLFAEVLAHMGDASPLIVELKTGPRRNELCEKALPLLRAYQGAFCIESFDPRIVAWFRKNAPEILRGQLSNRPRSFTGQPWVQRVVLGNLLSNFLARPQFVAYGPDKKPPLARLAEAMGAIRVCWTVRDTDAISQKQAENDAVIFEFYRPQARYLQE